MSHHCWEDIAAGVRTDVIPTDTTLTSFKGPLPTLDHARVNAVQLGLNAQAVNIVWKDSLDMGLSIQPLDQH